MEKSEIKPYNDLSGHLKRLYGEKIYKISLNGGMTCPNRDGKVGVGGCIFCSEGGSGDFASSPHLSITEQIEEAKNKVSKKIKNGKYVAYFQAFTNTYAPTDYLRKIFYEAISHPDVKILSIATRPDCLPEDVLDLLEELNAIKPVWVELGLQTVSDETSKLINRGYPLSVFDSAFDALKKRNIEVVTHVILGLPGETKEMMTQTVEYLAKKKTDGIKLQLLHVIKGTPLAKLWESGKYTAMTAEEYTDVLLDCIERLPFETVVHRITGDSPPTLLLAPEWSRYKWTVLNGILAEAKRRKTHQGKKYLQEKLFSLADEKYRDFNSKLVPTVPPEKIIGIRTPDLRKLAKEMSDAEKFTSALPHEYLEENHLHGFLIEKEKDPQKAVEMLDEFLPYVDNWETCDQIKLKPFKKHPEILLEAVGRWITSDKTYVVRFAIICLMKYFLDGDFSEEYPKLVANVQSDEYYVVTAKAWYFATALAKQRDAVLPYITEKKLDEKTHALTIKKAVESFRISDEDKQLLRRLKN